jgi:hypothetical protein
MPPTDIDRVQGDLKDPAFKDFKLRPVGVNLWEVTHIPTGATETVTCYADWTAFRDGLLETARILPRRRFHGKRATRRDRPAAARAPAAARRSNAAVQPGR